MKYTSTYERKIGKMVANELASFERIIRTD
jgi:hypothetical protein